MAYIVVAYIVVAYIVVSYIVVAYIVVAYIVMPSQPFLTERIRVRCRRTAPGSCGLMGLMRAHAGSCGLMRAHAGSCGRAGM